VKLTLIFKAFLGIVFTAALLIFIFPLISLLLPEKTKDHFYSTVTFEVIANRIAPAREDKQQQAHQLFDYVRMNIFLPRGSLPYEGKPLDYLIKGVGWCDYMARVFNRLLAQRGIPARYAMMMPREEGPSVHTLNEVYLGEKWGVFDPLTGVIFDDGRGGYYSLDEISADSSIRDRNLRISAIRELSGSEEDFYAAMFPIKYSPSRSEAVTEDIHIFDWITMKYVDLFGRPFSDNYQDFYLSSKTDILEGAEKLFSLARNYDLYGRMDKAEETYRLLSQRYPASSYAEDSQFFLGVLYTNQLNDFEKAKETLENLLALYPDSKWHSEANFYLGIVYDKVGDTKRADSFFLDYSGLKLNTDAMLRLISAKAKEEDAIIQ